MRPRSLLLRFLASGALLFAGAALAAMELELPLVDGSRFVRLGDYAGRPVLINFWGSECPPCIKEAPFLAAASRRMPGMTFLGVAIDERVGAQAFLARQPMPYPQLLAVRAGDVLLRRFGDRAGALPYTVILDTRHELCASRLGEVDDAWLSASAQACGIR